MSSESGVVAMAGGVGLSFSIMKSVQGMNGREGEECCCTTISAPPHLSIAHA